MLVDVPELTVEGRAAGVSGRVVCGQRATGRRDHGGDTGGLPHPSRTGRSDQRRIDSGRYLVSMTNARLESSWRAFVVVGGVAYLAGRATSRTSEPLRATSISSSRRMSDMLWIPAFSRPLFPAPRSAGAT